MTTPAPPPRTVAPATRTRGGGFSLTKQYGPLPVWAWGLGGGVALYAGYRFYKARQASTAATTNATTSSTYGTPIDYAPQLSTIQAEIQQLQQTEAGETTATTQPTTTPATTPTTHKTHDHNGKGSGGGVNPLGSNYGGPNVRGQTLPQAMAALQQAGYTVNNVSYAYQNVDPSNYGQYSTDTVASFTPYSNKTVNIGLN